MTAPTVSIASCVLGELPVKILSSLMSSDTASLVKEVQQTQALDVDLLEWRADAFATPTLAAFIAAAKQLKAVRTKPLLFTIRTAKEGGLLAIDDSTYQKLLLGMMASNLIDAVDIEISRKGATLLIDAAKRFHIPCIGSYHDFSGVPSESFILDLLQRMKTDGCDVVKMAVMPHDAKDTLFFMQTALSSYTQSPHPMIALAMGPYGQISRVWSSSFGSCATFASAAQASAPGQLSIADTRQMIQQLAQKLPQ